MKRRLLIIAIFLLLGAVTTVMVASVCAVLAPLGEIPTRQGALSEELDRWEVTWWEGIGSTRVEWEASKASVPFKVSDDVSELYEERVKELRRLIVATGAFEVGPHVAPRWGQVRSLDVNDAPAQRILEDARGWPMRALWCELRHRASDSYDGVLSEVNGQIRVLGGIPLYGACKSSDTHLGLRVMPYRVIPLGMLLDTLVFALMWASAAGVGYGIGIMRRKWRQSRQLCERCGYPISQGAGCPECGWRRGAKAV